LVWQRNYYEHVIRHERTLDHVRDYIRSNPARWAQDRENPMVRRLSGRPVRKAAPWEA